VERKPMIHTVSLTILGSDRKMECFEKWLVDNLQVRGIYLIYSFFAHISLTIILFVSAEKKLFLTRFKHESPRNTEFPRLVLTSEIETLLFESGYRR